MTVKLSRYIFKKIRGRIIPIRIGAKVNNAPTGLSGISSSALRKRQGKTNSKIIEKIKSFTKSSIIKDPVYHGTNSKFKQFDHSFIGKNGTALGKGFYFTNIQNEAKGYGKVGKYFLNINKPVKIGGNTLKRSHIRKIMRTSPDALSNYGDVNWEGKKKTINNALDLYKDLDDVEKINSVAQDNYHRDYKSFFKRLRNQLGIDSVIQDYPKRSKNAKHFVVFNSDQIMKAPKMNKDYTNYIKALKLNKNRK